MSSIIKSSYVIQSDKDFCMSTKEQLENLKDKMVSEAKKECKKIIDEAKKRADEILSKAQAEYENSIREAYDKSNKIIEDFRNKGYQEGYQLGKIEADKLIQEAIDIKKQCFKQKDNILNEIENDVITLVIDICQQVIGKTLAENKETILSIINKGLHSLNTKENLVIRVCPEDYELVEMSKQKILATANLVEEIHVKPDNTLTNGGCIIETSKGSVDTSVGTQLEEVSTILKDLLNRE